MVDNNQISSGPHPVGGNVHPGVVDPNNKDEEYLTETESNEANPTKKNEAEKAEDLRDEDFEKFDVDKVDELEESKKED